MHVHLSGLDAGTRAGPAFIANGVTGVRDMGSPLDEILTLRHRWRNASPSGPRLVAAGPILQGALPFELPLIRSVGNPAEARAAVDDLHRAGVDFIKVGDTVPPDAYRALADHARRRGLPVVGHLPVGIGAADAALAGQRSIEHFGSARFHGLLLAAASAEGPLARRVGAQYARVTGVISRIVRDPARAEELAADAFLRLWRTPAAHGAAASAWVLRTALRLGIDELRRATRRARYAPLLRFVRDVPTPEDSAATGEERRRVLRALSAIRREQAALLVLRSHGFSYDELATTLDLRSGSVETMLRRARQALRKEYVRRYGHT